MKSTCGMSLRHGADVDVTVKSRMSLDAKHQLVTVVDYRAIYCKTITYIQVTYGERLVYSVDQNYLEDFLKFEDL